MIGTIVVYKIISAILIQCAHSPDVWRRRFPFILGLSLLAFSGAGHATVISGSSSSYDVSANITATLLGTPLLQAGIGPAPVSAGSAPTPYNDSQQILNLQAGVKRTLSLGASVLNANAVSDIDGSDGDKFASASASITGLAANILAGWVSLNVGVLQSTASVSGDYGALGGFGGASLTNAFISIAGISIALDALPTPNTTVDLSLLGLAGVSLILNEQILAGDGIGSLGLAVNAIHLSFNGFLAGFFSLTGDIIISHAQAQIFAQPTPAANPVPEPATLALMASGFAVLIGKSRRKAAASLT
ncbi:PEP-CTERM sorting domain-containing protein [Methylocaldum sp. MU1018]